MTERVATQVLIELVGHFLRTSASPLDYRRELRDAVEVLYPNAYGRPAYGPDYVRLGVGEDE